LFPAPGFEKYLVLYSYRKSLVFFFLLHYSEVGSFQYHVYNKDDYEVKQVLVKRKSIRTNLRLFIIVAKHKKDVAITV